MRTREPELLAAGARLVFVGTGLPAMAADFARQHAGPWPVLSDTARKTFAAAGLRRGLLSTLRLRFVVNTWRAMRAGFRQTSVQGDPWQQGGAFVVDARGALRYQQVDEVAGDALDLDAIVAAAVRS